MLTLPSLPPTIRSLTSAESDRLKTKQVIRGSIDDWCPTCGGEKSFRWYVDTNVPFEQREVDEYACSCIDQFRLWRYFGYHGLGDLYARFSWGDAHGVSVQTREFVEGYLADLAYHARQGNGLFLHGTNGNGKTLLASLVFRRFLREGYVGYWATWNEMLDLYTTGWRDNEERAWFDATVRNAQVLVIDDLGKESIGRAGVAMPALDSMFRARVQSGQVTIMTTNESADGFRERYSKAIVSLAAEACIDHHFAGADYRAEWAKMKTFERETRLTRPLTFG